MMNARELEKWLRCPYCGCVDVEVRPAMHSGSMFVLECQRCHEDLEVVDSPSDPGESVGTTSNRAIQRDVGSGKLPDYDLDSIIPDLLINPRGESDQ